MLIDKVTDYPGEDESTDSDTSSHNSRKSFEAEPGRCF